MNYLQIKFFDPIYQRTWAPHKFQHSQTHGIPLAVNVEQGNTSTWQGYTFTGGQGMEVDDFSLFSFYLDPYALR